MGKLIFATNISLDGYTDHFKFRPDEEAYQYFIEILADTGAFIYGRKTYELMVPYWPDLAKEANEHEEIEYKFAKAYQEVPKIVVFSKTLQPSNTGKTIIFREGLPEEVKKLKDSGSKHLLMHGGVDLAAQLARIDQIDEYHLIIHPVILGSGRHLFENINLQDKLGLKLLESNTFASGSLLLKYAKQ